MRLFELDKWNLQVKEQAWGLLPFKKILLKDKSKDKELALKEMLFVWFYSDIKSNYNYIVDLKLKEIEIKKDLGLPKNWKINKEVKDAIKFYIERSKTVSSTILRDTYYTASKISSLMRTKVDSETELNVGELTKLTTSIKQMPDVIKAIQKTEDAVLKEQVEKSDKVGSQQKGMFEDGLIIE